MRADILQNISDGNKETELDQLRAENKQLREEVEDHGDAMVIAYMQGAEHGKDKLKVSVEALKKIHKQPHDPDRVEETAWQALKQID